MNDLKFLEGNDGFCDTWENDSGVIVCPSDGDLCPTYEVYQGTRPIHECKNYCMEDTPNSRWCLCDPEGSIKSYKTLKSAKAFLMNLARKGDLQ